MLVRVFQNVLFLSILGSVLAILWLMIKPITRKQFSPKWQYYIWLTVLVLLVLPVSFQLPYDTSAQDTSQIVTQSLQETSQEAVLLERVEAEAEPAVLPMAVDSIRLQVSRPLLHYLSLLWLLGALAIFIYKTIKYLYFKSILYNHSAKNTELISIPKALQVRRTNMVDAPLIIGLIRPILYLPLDKISDENMSYILMHELTHFKRHDLFYKWFAMFVRSIHWFNPIVYFVVKQIDEECEISCDYTATNTLSEKEKKQYMKLILEMASNATDQSHLLTIRMVSDKKLLKRRFSTIGKHVQPHILKSLLSIFLSILIFSMAIFTSGVFANELFSNQYTITVRNGTQEIHFEHQPFIKNYIVYLPIRETLKNFGYDANYITWTQTTATELQNNNGYFYEQILPNTIIDSIEIYVPDEFIINSGGYSDKNRNYLRIGVNEHILNGNFPTTLASACVIKNGIAYAPYDFFEYSKNAYQNMLTELNMTLTNGEKIIKFDTDINPYNTENRTKLTLDDIIIISMNSDISTNFVPSDFAGFIPNAVEENKTYYHLNKEYTLILENSNNEIIPWLHDNIWESGDINLNYTRFNGTNLAAEWNKKKMKEENFFVSHFTENADITD